MALLLMFLMILIVLHLNLKKITGQTENNGSKEVQIMAPLKYLSNFCKIREMPLINCEINIFF